MENALKPFWVLLESIALAILEVFRKCTNSAGKKVDYLTIWIDDRWDIPVCMKMFFKNWVREFSGYHKMNYLLICDIWILDALSEV